MRASDGAPESAVDNTDAARGDTRVWLHMYEGPGGTLLPNFCRRTGDANYMYDFTGAPPFTFTARSRTLDVTGGALPPRRPFPFLVHRHCELFAPVRHRRLETLAARPCPSPHPHQHEGSAPHP